MGRMKEVLGKRAQMGMGTLIVFIALILIAAVAAGVIISTTGVLQSKALATGKSATNEIATSVKVVHMYAEDGSNQQVNEFYKTVKLSPGSNALRFSDLGLTMGLDNTSADYEYDSLINCSGDNTTAGGDYGIAYSIQGPKFKSGFLNDGDVVQLCFESPRTVFEGDRVRVSFLPKVGNPSAIESHMPDLMVTTRVDVYP